VPYLGACIHVPPPPSNQIIYMLNSQVNDQKQNDYLKIAAHDFGPITINGQLETVSSNTSIGSAAYKLQVESIEKYQETSD
jgi:uncharacterized protein